MTVNKFFKGCKYQIFLLLLQRKKRKKINQLNKNKNGKEH